MDLVATIVWRDYYVLPLGAATILFFWVRGYLRRGALNGVARRRAELHPEDLLFGILLMLLGRILVGQVAGSLWPEILGDGSAASELAAEDYARYALLSQAALLPLLAFLIWRLGRQPGGLRAFGLWGRRPLHGLAAGLLALVTSLPVVLSIGFLCMTLSSLIGHPAPPVAHEMLLKVQQSDSQSAIWEMLVCSVIVAPVLEEIIYRGLVQSVLGHLGGFRNRWLIVLSAAALFALIHLGPQVAWQGLPVLFVLGIFLGWLYERTGSLWPGIVLHAGFNVINFLLVWHGDNHRVTLGF